MSVSGLYTPDNPHAFNSKLPIVKSPEVDKVPSIWIFACPSPPIEVNGNTPFPLKAKAVPTSSLLCIYSNTIKISISKFSVFPRIEFIVI